MIIMPSNNPRVEFHSIGRNTIANPIMHGSAIALAVVRWRSRDSSRRVMTRLIEIAANADNIRLTHYD